MSYNVDLKSYLPSIYEGVVEMEALQDSLSAEVQQFVNTCLVAMADQFIQTCSLQGIEYYERVFKILAEPLQETLEFRRLRILNRMRATQPPYTYRYLKIIFDGLLGKENYNIWVDKTNRLIIVDSIVSTKSYYHEILVTITNVKPCNLVFVNRPSMTSNLNINEGINARTVDYNYKLNNTWSLGQKCFVSKGPEKEYKMPSVQSLKQPVIQSSLNVLRTKITKALINEDVVIAILENHKVIENNILRIDYDLLSTQVTTITSIKLLDDTQQVYSEANVYIPVAENTNIVHNIKAQEG